MECQVSIPIYLSFKHNDHEEAECKSMAFSYSLLVVVAFLTFPLHMSISNQSLEYPIAGINIELDGKQIFQKQMVTGSQHNWEEINDLSVSGGEHILNIIETSTSVSTTEELKVERELWVVITFHGPNTGFKVDILDHPVGFM